MKAFACFVLIVTLASVVAFGGFLIARGVDSPTGRDGKPNDSVFFGAVAMAFGGMGLFWATALIASEGSAAPAPDAEDDDLEDEE